MSSGPLLMTADAGAYSALGDGGQPVWRRAAQLRAAIDTRLGRRHAELFAIPQEQGSSIEWRAPFEGTARPYTELSEAEKRALQSKVQELRPDLERLVDRLDGAGRSDGERAFGRLLRQALLAPGPETLFSVDSRPVLAFWGFTAEGTAGMLLGIAGASVASLPSWSTGPAAAAPPPPSPPPPAAAPTAWSSAPPPAPPAAAEPPSGQWPPGPPPPAAAPSATMAAVAPPAAPSLWKWLLVALFLLLLLAVAAYLVKPHLPRWVWDGKFTLPSTAGTGPAGADGADDSALRAEQAREAALRSDFLRLWAQFNEKRNQCTPGQQGSTTVVPGQDGGTVVVPGTTAEDGGTTTDPKPGGTVERPGPDGTTKPSTEAGRKPEMKPDMKPDTKTDTKPQTKADTTKPEAKPERQADAKPQPDPKANPKADQQRPPQQAARPTDPRAGLKPGEKPIEPVQIPKEPGVRFMQGDWRSSTDLTTQDGDEVIRPQYTFDKDGKGKSRIVQKNGVVCEGPAQASRDGSGKLVIKETEALKCTDGTTYAPSTVTCDSGADGRAQCQGSTEGGPGYAVRLGK
ncbi:hypothetical protein FHP25_09965 [Vineibacter terrae]|uniref:Uncharacterized protein n=1 Tax=Vineibacter terrae TaxID=2586908 RepID=A0A5C8PR39_9HYPH|nr:SrfA family protein [Vineibacter terrae]TXL77087.1 hypothetical protein FHP25_09965 [Vineibacter terrae]